MSKVWAILSGVAGLILAFVVAGIILTRIISNHDKRIVEEVRQAAKVHGFDSTESSLGKEGDSLRTVYVNQKVPYIVYRDRVIHENPKDTVLKVLAGKCDQLIMTCEQRQRVDSARIANLQSEVKTLKTMKAKKPSRVSAFAVGGYDFIHASPLAQLGGDLRLVGNLSVTGYVEASKTTSSKEVDGRAVAAIRFTFR